MKKMIFLLVSAVALLFNLAQPRPTTEENSTLSEIIDLAHQYNKSLHRDLFVEDVSALANAGCNNTFFCKVHDILEKHQIFSKGVKERKIVKNLNSYISGTKGNCTELLKNQTVSGRETEIPDLLDSLVKCIRTINFKG